MVIDVKLTALLGLVVIACFQRDLRATSCFRVPPCARVRASSVIFVGTVLYAGSATVTKDQSMHDVTFQVDEIFTGLSPSVREVVVTADGSWLIKGHSYLVDAANGSDHRLYMGICGASGELSDNTIAEFLDYLRQRAQGKAKTSLGVSVMDQLKPVSDVDVTIIGPEGQLTGRTGGDGVATFTGLKPANYRVAAARSHYKVDPGIDSDNAVDVVSGTCSSARIAILPDTGIGGRVVNATGVPMPDLNLELVTAPQSPAKKISLNEPFFEATTDAEGRFAFESVSPGRYLLGSNIIGLSTSRVPPTYYPGQRNSNAAYPIDVKLGDSDSNLLFTLPDFGHSREIQVCVVDENGRPMASVNIVSGFDVGGEGDVKLGENLTTAETGCATASGFAGGTYSIHASLLPPGSAFRQTRYSEPILISPGEEPVHILLVLEKPIGSPTKNQ